MPPLLEKKDGNTLAYVKIEVLPKGPNRVRGPIDLVDQYGNAYTIPEGIALCRCGQSNNKPFCDASHQRYGFKAESKAR